MAKRLEDPVNSLCPHCGAEFEKRPKRKTTCKKCGGIVYVRSRPDGKRYIVTEAQAREIELEWQAEDEDALHDDDEEAELEYGSYVMEVVGESRYQEALEKIAGGKTPSGASLYVIATLTPEPKNQYDPNAVAVYVQGQQVGYLSRPHALAWKSLLKASNKSRQKIGDIPIPARITGGWKRASSEGSFGVVLYLPAEIEETFHLAESVRHKKGTGAPAAKPTGCLGGVLAMLAASLIYLASRKMRL